VPKTLFQTDFSIRAWRRPFNCGFARANEIQRAQSDPGAVPGHSSRSKKFVIDLIILVAHARAAEPPRGCRQRLASRFAPLVRRTLHLPTVLSLPASFSDQPAASDKRFMTGRKGGSPSRQNKNVIKVICLSNKVRDVMQSGNKERHYVLNAPYHEAIMRCTEIGLSASAHVWPQLLG
jgi:hypothetical protein